ncbi:MAG: restriction endonuclease subunit S [Christensenellales bacterium]|jgi:type I restriction enzyme S subunit
MVIPKDWNIVIFSDLADVRDGTHDTPQAVDNGFPLVTSKSLKNGRIDYSGTYNISKEDYELINQRSKVDVGDILYAMIGTIGNPVLITYEPQFAIKNVALFKPYNKNLSPFLKHYLESPLFEKELENHQNGSNQSFISLSSFRSMKLVLPDEKEQTAIAEVLSDADSLISSLEKLIAKKKAIKQGAMQELLTGKKRLPGFSGEWVEKPLAELFVFSGGVSASRDQLSDKGYFYLHYGDIHRGIKSNIDTVADAFAIPKLDVDIFKVPTSSLLKDGDIVFVDASEDDEGASKHIVVRNQPGAIYIAGLHTIVAKSLGSDIDNRYREYCFKTADIKSQFKYYCAGTKVTGISKTNIAKITLRFPIDTLEQSAIASILSDMGTEIEQLEKKLAKCRLIKQGIMQELLTGRIRLIEENKKAESAAKGHNQHYDDAIAISAIVNAFYDDRFVLGRVKVQKLLYLLRRKQDVDMSAFKKKSAGPYNEKARYKGGESIAVKSGYITVERNNKGSKFGKGSNIDVALKYVGSMQSEIDWLLEKFRFYNTSKNTKNLEVLSTVDMAVCELEKNDKVVNLNAIKDVICSNEECAPKLMKSYFTDAAINQAIIESKELFG